jgi:hypothetical protein
VAGTVSTDEYELEGDIFPDIHTHTHTNPVLVEGIMLVQFGG